jgi:hypothetical protein
MIHYLISAHAHLGLMDKARAHQELLRTRRNYTIAQVRLLEPFTAGMIC